MEAKSGHRLPDQSLTYFNPQHLLKLEVQNLYKTKN